MSAMKCRALLRLVFAGLVVLPFIAGSKPAAACAGAPLLGSLCLFAGNFAPRGWALANGQLLPIAQNTALFSIIGTTYGGDGRTTFALPDLRGRVPISAGTGAGLPNYALGEKAGSPFTTLTLNNLPSHSHTATGTAKAATAAASTEAPAGAYWASDGRTKVYFSGSPNATTDMVSGGVAVSVGNTGEGQLFQTQSPYLAMNWIIATTGIFPSRN
ncbi:MAG: phage tail protein [Kiloniellaceae bacterium]